MQNVYNFEKLRNIAAKYNCKPDPNPCPSHDPNTNSNPNPIDIPHLYSAFRNLPCPFYTGLRHSFRTWCLG